MNCQELKNNVYTNFTLLKTIVKESSLNNDKIDAVYYKTIQLIDNIINKSLANESYLVIANDYAICKTKTLGLKQLLNELKDYNHNDMICFNSFMLIDTCHMKLKDLI